MLLTISHCRKILWLLHILLLVITIQPSVSFLHTISKVASTTTNPKDNNLHLSSPLSSSSSSSSIITLITTTIPILSHRRISTPTFITTTTYATPPTSDDVGSFFFDDDDDNENENDDNDKTEIESIVLSLSKESNDDVRRARLATLFATELNKDGSESVDEFISLFEKALERTGNEVQLVAKRKAELVQNDKIGGGGGNETKAEGGGLGEKSVEERQLWALVDMMVQSKVLIKKKFG